MTRQWSKLLILALTLISPALVSAQTAVARYFDPDASGTADGTSWIDAYTSWGSAISDIVTDYPDFVIADVLVTLNCRGSGPHAVTSTPSFTSTTDSTRYLEIVGTDFPPDGVLDSTKLVIAGDVQNGASLALSGNRVVIRNMQFDITETLGRHRVIRSSAPSSEMEVYQSIFRDTAQASASNAFFYFTGALSGVSTWDSVFYDTSGAVVEDANTGGGTFVNCTAVDNAEVFGGLEADRYTAINCLLSGNAIDFVGGVAAVGSDYNLTNNASGPTNWGANSLTSQSVTFENSASDNFALSAGDTALHSAGVGTTNSNVRAADIIGTARGVSTASIGAFEYFGGSPVSTTPIITLQDLGKTAGPHKSATLGGLLEGT